MLCFYLFIQIVFIYLSRPCSALGYTVPWSYIYFREAARVIWQSVKQGYYWLFVVARQAHDRPNRADTHRSLLCVLQSDCCGFEVVHQCLRLGEL